MDRDTQNFVVTAFVLSVGSEWFLITAGHCIHDIERLTHEFGYQITQCYLLDSMGLGGKHHDPIPFDYESASPTCLSEHREFDYGILSLSSYYKRLLETNNVQALHEEVWKKQPTKVDFYMLLGVPFELMKVDPNTVNVTTTLHKVEVLSQRPDDFPDTNIPLFYGQIRLGETVTNIEGMSGGPIFGFYQNDKSELRYWLIAIQSRWLPASHILMACPTKLLGLFLEEMIQKRNENIQ
jgi:hypothetical protein